MMFLIVGLGNPGPRYQSTRHNLGFMVVDFLARKHGTAFRAGKGDFAICELSHAGKEVMLLKPLTFMNNSGVAVEQVVNKLDVETSRILVLYDDFNLPFGRLRLRAAGSDGGHNGMASVIYHLQTEKIARMRIGIRNDDFFLNATQFVLSDFNEQEKKHLPRVIEQSACAAESVVENGISKSMNLFNGNLLRDTH